MTDDDPFTSPNRRPVPPVARAGELLFAFVRAPITCELRFNGAYGWRDLHVLVAKCGGS